MLSPSELKKRQFSKSLRGYSTMEVDEHLDFVLEKYTELYLRNDELEKELARLEGELEKVRQNEDAIRRAMVNAQREERKVIDEANDRAELILRTAKMNSDKILAEFKAKIREERLTLYKLRRAVREFKENSLKQYQLHLEFLNQISSDLTGNDPELELTEDDYANSLLQQMQLDLEKDEEESAKEEQEALNSPIRRAKPETAPPDKARTGVFEAVKKRGQAASRATTKEVPRANAATKEIPPLKKK